MTIRRLNLGYFIRPATETGGGAPRVEPVLGYLVRRGDGLLLFDTGMGSDPEVDAHYRPVRHDLRAALDRAGVRLDDVHAIINCHLHFDHCGGNPFFAGKPILVQRTELATARTTGYTIPELVDFAGASYHEVDGEAEISPGVWLIPTPGHTDGHQSLVIHQSDGTVILAGQAHDFAAQFGHDEMAQRAHGDGAAQPLPSYQVWLERLLEFDPRRVLFAHDACVWEPA